ncbi:hypothetical protein CEXT_679031 [Caerostris extrusa]|uniref:Uncharacterized protein n=1 Tax=Caerostris extrusa TaxID=172846 RepID=A0AAV4VY11_CAEEX|nr:hypothetical protein CEXT_679031 [Caerostris extrusa]
MKKILELHCIYLNSRSWNPSICDKIFLVNKHGKRQDISGKECLQRKLVYSLHLFFKKKRNAIFIFGPFAILFWPPPQRTIKDLKAIQGKKRQAEMEQVSGKRRFHCEYETDISCMHQGISLLIK